MPTTPINIINARSAVKYTGTNSLEIDILIDDFTVNSEVGGLLTFTSDGVSYSVPTGGWVTYWEGAVREVPFANDDDFFDVYRTDLTSDHVHELKLVTGPPIEGMGD